MSDFYFSSGLRRGTDAPATLQRDMANAREASYTTRGVQLGTSQAQSFASSRRIAFHGTGGAGILGQMVAKESKLLYPRMTQDHVFANLDARERPFLTVPYMGKGRKNVEREFVLSRGVRNPTDDELLAMKEREIREPGRHSFLPEGDLIRSVPMMPKEWTRGGENTVRRIVPAKK